MLQVNMYKCVSLGYLSSGYIVSDWVASQSYIYIYIYIYIYMECFFFVTVHSGAEYQHLY